MGKRDQCLSDIARGQKSEFIAQALVAAAGVAHCDDGRKMKWIGF